MSVCLACCWLHVWQAAELQRQEGNRLFSKGEWNLASECYHKGNFACMQSCAYVFMHACTCVRISVRIHVLTPILTHFRAFKCTCIDLHASTYANAYTDTDTFTYIHIHMHTLIHLYLCTFIYLVTYMYIERERRQKVIYQSIHICIYVCMYVYAWYVYVYVYIYV